MNGGGKMKYVAPIIILIGFFTLLFVKAAEVYEIEKQRAMTEKVVIDLKTKQQEKKELNHDLSLKALFINEVEEEPKEDEPQERKSFTSGPIFYGNVSNRQVAYLTFDDGPSKNTEQILNILKEYEIPATFFVNGNQTEFGKKMYQRIVNEGHSIGNHTYSHNYASIYQSIDHFLEDFLKMEQLLIETVGFAPNIIRYPGGSNNTVSHRYGGSTIMDEIIFEMEQLGYLHSDWNIDSLDSTKVRQSKSVIIDSVLNGAKGKDELIILLHDGQAKTTTVEALPHIIEGLKEMGYHFERMTEETFYIQFNHAR